MPIFNEGEELNYLEKDDILMSGSPDNFSKVKAQNLYNRTLTRTQLQALISANTLNIGQQYTISNAVSNTMALKVTATGTNILDNVAVRVSNGVNYIYNITTDTAEIIQQINGTGFVKANGTTITYDNSTYLTNINGITAGGELSGTYPNPSLSNNAVTGKVLTGLSISGSSIVSTDSILTSFGKLQNQINSLVGGVNYQGTWNAFTNTPALASGVGVKGYYYVVSVAGSTNLDGITDWKLGDWVIFDGITWQKVDNTDAVISVNGYTGIVTLTTSDINEGTNLYYTDARVRQAISENIVGINYDNNTGVFSLASGYVIPTTTEQSNWNTAYNNRISSLTTLGNSGAATLIQNVLNIPNYTLSGLGGVPYTGATANVNLGEFGIQGGYFGYDLTPTNTPTTQGTTYWDSTEETVALIMNGAIQHIGLDTFYNVKNNTGFAIPKGTAVRFAGTDGNSGHLLIAPMLADGSYPSSYYMGITAEVIANGDFGKVVDFGKLRGINTNSYTNGDILYVSTTVAGSFQTTVPTAPNNIIIAATVVNASNNGTLMVRATLGSNINNDEGVKITSPTNGQLLQLQSNGLWENKTKAQILGGTSSQFVKGDGSLDSNNYALLSSISGTTGKLAKFTSSGAVGDSIVSESSNGITTSINQSASTTLVVVENTNNTSGTARASLRSISGAVTSELLSISGFGLFLGTSSNHRVSLMMNGSEYLGINATNGRIQTNQADDTGESFIVGGSARVNGALTVRGSGSSIVDSANSFALSIGASSANPNFVAIGTSGSGVPQINGYNNAFSATTSLALQPNGSNVLIGTTTDNNTDKLQVSGSLKVTGASTFGVFNANSPAVFTTNNTASTPAITAFKNTEDGNADVLLIQSYFGGTGIVDVARIKANGAATFSSSVTWGSASGQYMYAGGASHIFAYSNSTSNYLYSGGSGGFNINNAADSVVLMRVTDAGNVGIGTTSPSQKLDVNGNIALSFNGESLIINDQRGTDSISIRGAAYINFHTFNGSSYVEHMRITSSGNVGIGVTNPSQKLGVRASDPSNGIILAVSNNNGGNATTGSKILFDASGIGNFWEGMPAGVEAWAVGLFNGSTNPEYMRITSGGNVGIGTTSPTSKLSISDGATMYASQTGTLLDINRNVSNGNDTTSRSGLRLGNNSNTFQIWYGGTTDRLRFVDGGGSEVLTLVNGGNVGIGTTSPAAKLDVNGSIAIGNAVTTSTNTPSTHKVEIVIGGVTYYLLATT